MENDNEIVKSSAINLNVHLNKAKLPVAIDWKAEDSPNSEKQNCEAFQLSIWDTESKSAFKIDLWTTKMTIEEMNHFTFQNMFTIADSFFKATGNKEEAEKIRTFAKEFGERNEVIKPS